MTALKPRIRLHIDGTVSRRVATHDGWMWVKESRAKAGDDVCGYPTPYGPRKEPVIRHASGRTLAATYELMDVTAGETAPHSRDGASDLGGLTTHPENALIMGVSSQDLPAPDRSEAGLSGGDAGGISTFPHPLSGLDIPVSLRRHDGLSVSDRIALICSRAAA